MNAPAMAAPSGAISQADKALAIICHVSLFLGGIGYLILPLVVYLVKKDDSPFVSFHAKEALNFHLSLLLYFACMTPLFLVFACMWIGIKIETPIRRNVRQAVQLLAANFETHL